MAAPPAPWVGRRQQLVAGSSDAGITPRRLLRNRSDQLIFNSYIERIHELLEQIRKEQGVAIERAGGRGAESLRQSKMVHTFGTGHSHMIAEEAFFRAGGLVPVNAILDSRLSFLDGA